MLCQNPKDPFIATQLNLTLSLVSSVELSCIGKVFIAMPTQLNSTQLTYFVLIGCMLQLGQLHCDRWRQLSCVR